MKIRDRLTKIRDYVVEEYRSGRGTSSLGKEFGCNSATVYLLLRGWGEIDRSRERPDCYGDESYDKTILDMHSKGMTAHSIAKAIGISKPTVLRRANKMGISFSGFSSHTKPVKLKDLLKDVLSLHDSGVSANEIANRLGYNSVSVWTLLKKHGRDTSLQCYEVDLTFFDVIDTEEKAYILGLWYADGNVAPDKIRLCMTDREIIERAKEAFRYEGPIIEIHPRKENRKTQYLLAISRKDLVAAITSKGCVPNKSLILTWPGDDIVPRHLIRHFARGYFDGDGHLSDPNGKSRVYASVLGTREFLEGMSESVGIPGYWSQRHPERENNNWTWSIGKKCDISKLADWLYADATIFLRRKYDRYLSLIAEDNAKLSEAV